MSGCHPQELRCKHGRVTQCHDCEKVKCSCNCHETNVRFLLMSNPPRACCECDMPKIKCEHEFPIDVPCPFCNGNVSPMVKKIQDLEKIVIEINNKYLSCEVMFIARQTIETWQKGCEALIGDLQCRIKRLEESYQGLFHDTSYINERMKELEEDIEDLQVFRSAKLNRPHKCPVCDGVGTIHIDFMCSQSHLLSGWKKDAMGIGYKDCVSCEGKGIVWS